MRKMNCALHCNYYNLGVSRSDTNMASHWVAPVESFEIDFPKMWVVYGFKLIRCVFIRLEDDHIVSLV